MKARVKHLTNWVSLTITPPIFSRVYRHHLPNIVSLLNLVKSPIGKDPKIKTIGQDDWIWFNIPLKVDHSSHPSDYKIKVSQIRKGICCKANYCGFVERSQTLDLLLCWRAFYSTGG